MNPAPRRRGGRRRRGAASRRPQRAIEPLRPTADPPAVERFDEWPLDPDVLKAIADMGITTPTPIQRLAIGPVLEGKDVIAKAETGTGKTLAFGGPIISRIDPGRRTVLALILSPTRELAEQVHDVLETLGRARDVRTALIVGGEAMGPQVEALQEGAQVVVGTPGRVLDLMGQGFLSFPWTEYVVLDEADKMLEIGFIDDVKKILDAANEYRNTLLFSATFPTPLLELARGYTTDPVEVATALGVATVDTIEQRFMKVDEDDKAMTLARLIERSEDEHIFLVFCDRRTDVDRLLRRMERRRFPVKALHGGYDQASRFRVMSAFRQKEVKALLATDVASRGLDVVHVTHVVNFGVPRDASDYTHRIGRTGRAGREGIAITLVSEKDSRRWSALKRSLPFDIEEGRSPADLLGVNGAKREREDGGRDRKGRGRQRDGGKPQRGGGDRRRAEEPRTRESKPEQAPERPPEESREPRREIAPGGGFGVGLEKAPQEQKKKEKEKAKEQRGKRKRPEPRRDADSTDRDGPPSGGFGAGI